MKYLFRTHISISKIKYYQYYHRNYFSLNILKSFSLGNIKTKLIQWKKEWDEIDEAMQPMDIDVLGNKSIHMDYSDLTPQQQKQIREETWKLYAMTYEEAELEIDKMEREFESIDEGTITFKSMEDDDTKNTKEKEKTIFTDMIEKTKESLSLSAKDAGFDINDPNALSPENLKNFALNNKDNLKVVALEKMEFMEELIQAFNESYQTHKKESLDKVLAEEDYLDKIQAAILKGSGLDEISNVKNQNTESPISEKQMK